MTHINKHKISQMLHAFQQKSSALHPKAIANAFINNANNENDENSVNNERSSSNTSHLKSLGPNAADFIRNAPMRYEQNLLSPPLNLVKVQAICDFFEKVNQDLTGNFYGTDTERQRAYEWQRVWAQIKTDFKDNEKLVTEYLTLIQQNVLSAYRTKMISMCFSQKAKTEGIEGIEKIEEIDEQHAREFLLLISDQMYHASPMQVYETLMQQLHERFEQRIGLDLQVLSRYLSTSQHINYLKKFEETLANKHVLFLGKSAKKKIFAAIQQDKEFEKQMPFLLEKCKIFRNFMRQFLRKKNSLKA